MHQKPNATYFHGDRVQTLINTTQETNKECR